MNAGPGAIAGLFVHERHGKVEYPDGQDGKPVFRHRLTGWYGGDKASRFQMDNSKFDFAAFWVFPPYLFCSMLIECSHRIQTHPWRRGLPDLKPISNRPSLTMRLAVRLQRDGHRAAAREIAQADGLPPISPSKGRQDISFHLRRRSATLPHHHTARPRETRRAAERAAAAGTAGAGKRCAPGGGHRCGPEEARCHSRRARAAV